LPYALADLVGEKVLTSRVPDVVSAWRLVGEGTAAKLRVVRLGGRVRFDPCADDWWAACQRARAELGDSPMATGMKTIDSGTAYGDWIRFDQQPQAGSVAVQRFDGPQIADVSTVRKTPAPWAFPPFASAVTAGGRLLADEGGTFASANTDSATVVSTRAGGLVACPGGTERLDDGTSAVRALSWAALDAVSERFAALGVELRLTPENFDGDERRQLHAVGVAGSRVILYRDDRSSIRRQTSLTDTSGPVTLAPRPIRAEQGGPR
jgi:hypothetical protein